MIWLPRLKEKVQTEREKERDEERVSKGREVRELRGLRRMRKLNV